MTLQCVYAGGVPTVRSYLVIVQPKAAEGDSKDRMGCVWKTHTSILLVLSLYLYSVQIICIRNICQNVLQFFAGKFH